MINNCRCRKCVHVRVNQDSKGWNRITCKYSPNKEFLGNYCEEPLNDTCGHYRERIVKHDYEYYTSLSNSLKK